MKTNVKGQFMRLICGKTYVLVIIKHL